MPDVDLNTILADGDFLQRVGDQLVGAQPTAPASYSQTVSTVLPNVPVNVVHNLNSANVSVHAWRGGRLVTTEVRYVDPNTIAIATGAPTTVRVVVKP